MNICHGVWVPGSGSTFDNEGRFVFWIESDESTSGHKTGDHPNHIADPDRLDNFLESELLFTTTQVAALDCDHTSFHMNLPGIDNLPLPSFEMAQLKGDYLPDDFVWNTWRIHGLLIGQPLLFLKELQFMSSYARSDIHIGSDLAFWLQFAQQFRNLMHLHQFLPVMKCRHSSKDISTGWSPGSGMYERTLMDFAISMPDVCKAVSKSHSKSTEDSRFESLSGMDLLRHFSENQVDRLVANTPFTKQILNQVDRTWLVSALDSGQTDSSEKPINYSHLSVEQWKHWRVWQSEILGRTTTEGDEQVSGFVLGIRLSQIDDGEDGSWRLGFFVGSTRDPSLRIDLEEWWQLSGKKRNRWLKHFGQKFERNLLVSMGHAARICPLLWQGMEEAQPTGVDIDLPLAYEFLKNDASVLESAGFRILVPSWWTPQGRKRARIRINAAARSRSTGTESSNSGLFSLQSVVDYRYELSIGGEVVTAQEWRDLINAKSPLVKFRGEWVELDGAQMGRMLELFQDQQYDTRSTSMVDLLKHIAESDSNDTEFVFNEVLDHVLQGLLQQEKIETLEQPSGLAGVLRPYQKKGLSWLATQESLGLNPCLADDMGLGKTIQVIALLLHERERLITDDHSDSETIPPTLLIAPTSVLSNWQKEIERFSPQLICMIHHGGDRADNASALADAATANDIVITSFSIARKDSKLLKQQTWRRIVVDEAQNIKNPKSAQAKAICSLEAPHRIALTGTPIENRLTDLWSLFNFLTPGYLGTASQFRRAYETPIKRESDRNRANQLQQLVRPFILRRLKTDKSIITDLPEKLEQKVYCNLTKEQASLYQAVVDDVQNQLEELEGIQRKGMILSTLMKLKQICNHPAQFLQDGSAFSETRSHKLARLNEMIHEALEESDSLLVFTQFTEVGDQLNTLLRENHACPVYYLHGGVNRKRREQMIENFQDPDSLPGIFILSLRAGGVGITLTQANHVFHFDRWWNPAVENQATDRAFRIGQKKTVLVHKMVTLGTLEEQIDKMIEEKQALADSIVGTDENWLTEMDDSAFRQLIQLNRSAIMEA